ncbi:MAG: heavy metal translocating P-type ATPase [Hyphomicrobium sp.]
MMRSTAQTLPALEAERRIDAGTEARCKTLTLTVENMHCGHCMRTVEKSLLAAPGVASARVNLSARRVAVSFNPAETDSYKLIEALAGVGFKAAELSRATATDGIRHDSDLLRRLGVAGFAAANIMLLSVSVWAGLASDMDPSIKAMFHWLSAAIAVPVVAYSGQPFFASAFDALKSRRVNMDVPISLGLILATAMSVFQVIRGSEQVYFDAAVTLAFFLLTGRYLDSAMRTRARGAAENLLGFQNLSATLRHADGTTERVNATALLPGMRIIVAAGERIAVDGTVATGESDVDESLMTGETEPRPVRAGDRVHAGTVNLSGIIDIEATATDDNTLVAEIARLMSAAEQGRGRYVRLADRAARLYAPAVHVLALVTFAGWMLAGATWIDALTCAIAVLIITCPCALALAVPAVQVAATSRLFARGVIVKAADGLERLAEVDWVVLDKTGTLTRGEPILKNIAAISRADLAVAASLAQASRHPYARAVVAAARQLGVPVPAVDGVEEVTGLGMKRAVTGGDVLLGSARFVDVAHDASSSLWLKQPGLQAIGFQFEDTLRSDAARVVSDLQRAGFGVEIVSGDRPERVADAAAAVGIHDFAGGVLPEGKMARLAALKRDGRRILMVGDGLNDAPALAAGHASISPSTAVDVAQTAADCVFQGEALGAIVETLAVSQKARAMALQNFAISIGYNALFVPLAMAGYVTPLIAALAMSGSSIAVTVNALRLKTARVSLQRTGAPS